MVEKKLVWKFQRGRTRKLTFPQVQWSKNGQQQYPQEPSYADRDWEEILSFPRLERYDFPNMERCQHSDFGERY